MLRTQAAGELRADHAGQTVTLAGWVARRRDHGGVAFLDLRDGSGVAQVVVRDQDIAAGLRNEFCILVEGRVERRPAGNENPNLPTGEVEVLAESVEVLSESAPLPFPVDETTADATAGEETRLRYRYLDLRRAGPAAALRLRSKANQAAREVLLAEGFVEIETPTMTRSTPEGARDFLVPARLHPGSWYALPQSPQLFKQLLMVAGFERYFQIARCYRDEDFRADRQPEFTQLDIEMSFVGQDDVMALSERVVAAVWKLVGHDVSSPIPRMTYQEAMDRYGSDKPDLRLRSELTELTYLFANTSFRIFQAPYVGAVVYPGGAALTRREFDDWQEWARARGGRGLAYAVVEADGELSGPLVKNLSVTEKTPGLADLVGAGPGDAIFFAAGERIASQSLLGAARLEIGRRTGAIDEDAWEFVWIVDYPLFEPVSATTDVAVGSGRWTAVHHAFTAPHPAWIDRFDEDPERALSQAYDLVCNGTEIGGGSIRIHRADIQQRVFDVMGLSADDAREKFGFLLEAFAYGAPPHGGIAFGWDRTVALLASSDSIRDVIAFPKSGGGYDPLTGAPAPITEQQRKEAGVDVIPPARSNRNAVS